MLNAVGGLGNLQPTMATGLLPQNNLSGNDFGQSPQMPGQLPQMSDQLQGNPSYMNTIQRFFSGPQSTFNAPMQQPIRHAPGRDNLSSGIGLDQTTILNNIGLGGR